MHQLNGVRVALRDDIGDGGNADGGRSGDGASVFDCGGGADDGGGGGNSAKVSSGGDGGNNLLDSSRGYSSHHGGFRGEGDFEEGERIVCFFFLSARRRM